ncbi:DUF4011 domain-containing protein [Dyadobacter sp. 3J3]|uniref:DUF4011 domain-containing protein n=1 Tax=Dyadobacter sp. 3J3 TaxID=2606600 RepID=UPI001358B0E0|nr:DUF4011 domain-containing protein [Dyadobacter sp. 3J3]
MQNSQLSKDQINTIVIEGLEKTRQSLLDLSGRNRLLNFKHSGTKILRFVDELPNQIYSELLASSESDQKKGFLISPVPIPKKSEYPLSKDLKAIDVRSHAQFLGISTDWEMQASNKSEEKKHSDDKLQTLLYPESLDGLLRRMQSEARTAIEESGVNMLFLCLGFLKWSDSNNSDTFSEAPLLMIPIQIEREKSIDTKTGLAKYRLKHTGEDIVDNICLREKLKQFAIDLPSFEAFETPDEYFNEITIILEEIKPEWSIQRFATAGFWSFGKMLMYLDLDPKRWPNENGISNSLHIIDIFSGNHSNDGNVAQDFAIDTDKSLPRLNHVLDADSSQHNAILDVIKGKNIVIEGPPGTGKSQTITNLIAACLAEGKTVLFVAEKLAALEVVTTRLNEVGLGEFCLELHSHKTQKKALMADLKKRLELNTSNFINAFKSAELRSLELDEKKKKLLGYSNAVNTPFGKLAESPYKIFWKTEVLKKDLSQNYSFEKFDSPKNVSELTESKLRKDLDKIKDLSDKLREYFEGEYKNDEHFWSGFKVDGPLSFVQKEDIYQELKNLSNTSLNAYRDLADMELYGLLVERFDSYKKISLELKIFTQNDFRNAHFFELINPRNLKSLGQTKEKFDNYKLVIKEYYQICQIHNVRKDEIEKLKMLMSFQDIRFSRDLTIHELAINDGNLKKALVDFDSVKKLFEEGAKYLDLDSNSINSFSAVVHAAKICKDTNKALLIHRNGNIEKVIDNPELIDLTNQIVKLRDVRLELDKFFRLDQEISIRTLEEIQKSFSEKNLFSTFSNSYRSALASFRLVSRSTEASDFQLASQKIENLIQYLKDAQSFAKHELFNKMLPGIFNGIDTNIESLEHATNFYKDLRSQTLTNPRFGSTIYKVLSEQDLFNYTWFTQQENALSDGLKSLIQIKSILLSNGVESDNLDNIASILLKSEDLILAYQQFNITISQVEIPNSLTINKLKNIYKYGIDIYNSRKEIEDDFTASNLKLSLKEEDIENQIILLSDLIYIQERLSSFLPETSLPFVLCSDGFQNLGKLKTLTLRVCEYLDSASKLETVAPGILNLNEFWKIKTTKESSILSAISLKLSTLHQEQESYDKWCDILLAFTRIKSAGLGGSINDFYSSSRPEVPFSDFIPLYRYLVYSELSNEVLRNDPVLGSFNRITHENIRTSFKETDIELKGINAQMLSRELSKRIIPDGEGGKSPKLYTDSQLIRHEIGKQKAHIPIRQLIDRSFQALVAMKPCFMMGPLSVAQYLAPGHKKFDILIMDEASQVKPEDAVGMLARANQVVIVGDSNQLPPTGFFDTIGEQTDEDEEATSIQHSESILDVCKPIFQPVRRLKWHYRSQHQSLISFSNHHFYDNDLVIFPSPTAHSDSIGVKHIYVSDGVYTNQTNLIEAARLVKDLMEMIERFPLRSYGIVTLNAKQKMIIEDEIERVRKTNSNFDAFIDNSEMTSGKLFVKNLENVQGDERDVIYISTTFGPNQNGAFLQNFGPIVGKNGWRRLNVLFTRAKQHIRIFSSFYSEQIKIVDSKEQRGLKALKDYLHFAATGIDNHAYITQREPDSDFEKAVGSFLKEHGFEIVYQLGVSGYLIDIVVKHPKMQSDFVIAIECDGATYHSAKSARDRDRLREANLRNLGWNHIHRIWSTDWFKRREHEEKRLIKAVEEAIVDFDTKLESRMSLNHYI